VTCDRTQARRNVQARRALAIIRAINSRHIRDNDRYGAASVLAKHRRSRIAGQDNSAGCARRRASISYDEATMFTGRMTMAKVEKVAATAVRRAKATAGRMRQKGIALATQLAESATELAGKKTVKQAKKTVARARTQVSTLASKAVAKITGRPKKKTRSKVAVAAAGAAAVAAAAGLSLARRRRR
jgi:hypothetical protein